MKWIITRDKWSHSREIQITTCGWWSRWGATQQLHCRLVQSSHSALEMKALRLCTLLPVYAEAVSVWGWKLLNRPQMSSMMDVGLGGSFRWFRFETHGSLMPAVYGQASISMSSCWRNKKLARDSYECFRRPFSGQPMKSCHTSRPLMQRHEGFQAGFATAASVVML